MAGIGARNCVMGCLALFLGGCVMGIVVPSSAEERYDDGRTATAPLVPKQALKESVSPAISQKDGYEVREYRYSNLWCGAIVLSIPILLPLCSHSETYYLKESALVKRESQDVRFIGCGALFEVSCSASRTHD